MYRCGLRLKLAHASCCMQVRAVQKPAGALSACHWQALGFLGGVLRLCQGDIEPIEGLCGTVRCWHVQVHHHRYREITLTEGLSGTKHGLHLEGHH